MKRARVLWVENPLRGTPLNPSTSLRLRSLLLIAASALVAFAACEAPTVGDSCGSTCAAKTTCEAICPCGNASCLGYECVGTDEAGAFVLPDGGEAKSCSQL